MQNKHNEILKRITSEITPNPFEVNEIKKQANEAISRINNQLVGIGAKATIEGSFKKHTQLKHVFDIDIFVQFNYKKYSHEHSNISTKLGEKLKTIFPKVEKLHGSRDYFLVDTGKFAFEIVPILKITTSHQAKNITDISPLHTKWVLNHSKGKIDDIRITKAFLKAQRIYGAESYVRGFSGYACEVLLIHYGSFIKLLSATAKWKKKQVIDPEKAYKRDDPLLKLNKSKTLSPLILIDPVQNTRNVTAALSQEAFEKFKKAAATFLKKPSPTFFKSKIDSKEDLLQKKSKHHSLLLIELVPKKNKHDVVGAVILNRYELLRKALHENKFSVEKSSWFWEKHENGALWFLLSKKLPNKLDLRTGPPTKDKENCKKFRKKHKYPFIKKGRMYAYAARKFQNPKTLIQHVIKSPNFMKKIKSVKIEWH